MWSNHSVYHNCWGFLSVQSLLFLNFILAFAPRTLCNVAHCSKKQTTSTWELGFFCASTHAAHHINSNDCIAVASSSSSVLFVCVYPSSCNLFKVRWSTSNSGLRPRLQLYSFTRDITLFFFSFLFFFLSHFISLFSLSFSETSGGHVTRLRAVSLLLFCPSCQTPRHHKTMSCD